MFNIFKKKKVEVPKFETIRDIERRERKELVEEMEKYFKIEDDALVFDELFYHKYSFDAYGKIIRSCQDPSELIVTLIWDNLHEGIKKIKIDKRLFKLLMNDYRDVIYKTDYSQPKFFNTHGFFGFSSMNVSYDEKPIFGQASSMFSTLIKKEKEWMYMYAAYMPKIELTEKENELKD